MSKRESRKWRQRLRQRRRALGEGIVATGSGLRLRKRRGVASLRRGAGRRGRRACRFEPLESRQMLAINVVEPLGQWDMWEDGDDMIVDLRPVFRSDCDQSLAYEVVTNSRADLVAARIDEWALRLQVAEDQVGAAEIVIRAVGATDALEARDTLSLHVAPVNDWPTLVAGFSEMRLPEGGTAVIDLTEHFADLEQEASELTYSAAPFEASFPGNPVRTASIQQGVLTLELSPDGYGYAQYAVRAVDDEGAQAATTLLVVVDPVNDAPTATQMPDRHHRVSGPQAAPLVALDLWYQHYLDGTIDLYFWDVEDEVFLQYSVSVDNSSVFDLQPRVDSHNFLLYRPTAQPGFQGSAVVTITATDREGVEARLADGSRPAFTVHVNNPAAAAGVPWGGNVAGDWCTPTSPVMGVSGDGQASGDRPPSQGLDAVHSAASTAPPTDSWRRDTFASVGYLPESSALPLSQSLLVGPLPPSPSTAPLLDNAAPLDNTPLADYVWPDLPIWPGTPADPGVTGPIVPAPGNPSEDWPLPTEPPPWQPHPGIGYPLPLPLPQPSPGWPDPTMPPIVPPPWNHPPLPVPPDPLPPPPGDPGEIPPGPGVPDPGYPDPPPPPPGDPVEIPPGPGVPDPGYPDPGVPDPGVPDPGVPDPIDPPPAPPPGTVPDPTQPPPAGSGQGTIVFDLDALRFRVPDALERDPGVLVALNDDFDEQNLADDLLFVGPHGTAVSALARVRDNQPDRIPEQGREHHIAASWQMSWLSESGESDWQCTMDDDVRPAIVTSNVKGSVTFDVPDHTKLWVPAWALYGVDAVTGVAASWRTGMRWIEVRAGESYRLDYGPWNALTPLQPMAIPLAIEGMELGNGELTATFSPQDGRAAVEDAMTVHVVAVDLDVDSDNNDALRMPARSIHEEDIENDVRVAGKRLPVNGDDVDRDNIPDFVDGYDLDGQSGMLSGARTDDDRISATEQLGFVPVVVELLAPIDPQTALLRFVYSGSDPAAATIAADASRDIAQGALRLWTVDEMHARRPQSIGDPVSPGHYVAPHAAPSSVLQADRMYRVSQLTGGSATSQFTLYLEGVRAGQYTLSIEVDPDGVPRLVTDAGGQQVPEYVDLFEGFVLHDVIHVTVESVVEISAVNVVGGESDASQRPDRAGWEITRGPGDVAGGLMVYYRLLFDTQHAYAEDAVTAPSRFDFRAFEGSRAEIGLADDPLTRIGSAFIPDGESTVTLTIEPEDDDVVEWDEWVSIELIPWDEYRQMHDVIQVATPNDGLPVEYSTWAWWDYRSPYRLKVDADQLPIDHVATVELLDNDQAVSTSYQQPDVDSTDLASNTIGYGLLEVDLRGGHGHFGLPTWAPRYREDDNLFPIGEVVLRLPEETAAVTALSGVFTVGGLAGEETAYEVAALQPYLAPNRSRELRLVVRGPEDLVSLLSTGHYDHDIRLAAVVGDKTVTRTIRGATDIVNRVDDALGTAEFGQRWTLDELDRLVPGDGISSGGVGQPTSRLAQLGARTESGLAVVHGDNAVTWFPLDSLAGAGHDTLPRLVEVNAGDEGLVRFSDPLAWVGSGGDGEHAYRTTAAGLQGDEAEVVWTFSDVVPDRMYQVYVHWDAAPTHASNAHYEVAGTPVGMVASQFSVDQRYVPGELQWDGRSWRSLGFFTAPTAGDPLEVRLTTRVDESSFADGLLSAGAVMLVDTWEATSPCSSFSSLAWSPAGETIRLTTKSRDVYEFAASTGLLQELRDRNGNRTQYHYVDADQDGRQDELAEIVRQGGLQTSFQYVSGFLAGITDFAGSQTRWQTVDGLVRQVTLVDPGHGLETPVYRFAYDPQAGLLSSVTDPRGNSTNLQREPAAHRVHTIDNPDGYTWSLEAYLVDGLQGSLYAPAAGGIGAREGDLGLMREPRATYVDTRAGVWTYQLDPYGLLTAEARPATADSPQADVWCWHRDERGLVTRIVLPPGGGGAASLPTITIHQQYDERGNLLQRTHGDGTSEAWTYDEVFSQVETYRDALQRLVSYELDGRGNVLRKTEHEERFADTPARHTAYAFSGKPDTIDQLPGGLVTTEVRAAVSSDAVMTLTEYFEVGPHVGLPSAVHEVANAADPRAVVTTRFRYDDRRNLAEQIDPLGRSTLFVHDRLGRLHQQIDPLPGTGDHGQPVTTFLYDTVGNNTTMINARGAVTLREFDEMNRMAAETLPAPGGHAATDQAPASHTYLYDGEGNVVAQWDPYHRPTTYMYDARNQLISMIQPVPETGMVPLPSGIVQQAPVTLYTYDAWGNLRTLTDPRGATTSFQYDAFQRPIVVTQPVPSSMQPDAPVTRFVYDAAGQLLEKFESGTRGWRVTSYAYDDLGRLRLQQLPADTSGGRPTTAYSYDLRDNMISVTEPGGHVTNHRYDQLNQLTDTVRPDPDAAGPLGYPTTRREYNLDGSLRRETTFDSADPLLAEITQYEYDALGRVTRIVQSDPDGSGPGIAPEVNYRYDIMGNCVSERVRASTDRFVTRSFHFDNRDRLWMTHSPVTEQVATEVVSAFDRVGNEVLRLEKTEDLNGVAQYRRSDSAYDSLGRRIVQMEPAADGGGIRPVTYFVYDAVGNVRYQIDPAGNRTEYQFDTLNQVVAVIEPATVDHASPITRFEYTVAGDLQAVVDPLGRRTEYEYDDLGRMIVQRKPMIDGEVPTTQYGYDLRGNALWIADSDGNVVQMQYDALDRPVRIVENASVLQRSYDGLGRVALEANALGEVTRYGYDLLGRRTITAPPHPAGRDLQQQSEDDDDASLEGSWYVADGGWRSGYRYADLSADNDAQATWCISELQPGATYEVLLSWDPDARNTDQAVLTLRDADRLLADPLPIDQRKITGDVVAGGRAWQRIATVTLASESLELSLQSGASAGRLVADGVWIVEVGGNAYTSYDARGNIVAQSDALGNVQQYTYDGHSNQTSATDEQGHTTYFRHDLLGHQIAVIDPLGNATSYEYDALDRMTAEWIEQDGVSAVTRFEYDLMGNLQQVVDRMGRVRTMSYDALGRAKDEVWYATLADALEDENRQNAIHRTYDAAGRLTAVSDNAGSYEYTLDVLNRVVETTVDTASTPSVVLHNDYSRHDGLRDALATRIGDADDLVNRYFYDAQSRLARLEQTGRGVDEKRVDIRYSPVDQLVGLQRYADRAGGEPVVRTEYEYDSQGRLVSLAHQQGAELLAAYAWQLDTANRVIQAESLLDGVTRYQYDASSQLVSASHDNQPDESFAYDENGNRASDEYVIGERNLVTSDGDFRYEYDAAGNRIKRVELATGKVTQYQWDVLNRLVAIVERAGEGEEASRTIEYTYDVWGRRIGKSIQPAVGPEQIEAFVYDGQDILLRFTQGNLANRYLHGPAVDQVLADEQVGEDGDASSVLWPLTDNLGTVRDLAVYDESRDATSIAQHITYGAFGNIVAETQAAVDHIFGFTGRETDPESDIYFYRARYYDPRLGQFLSEDPLGFDAGDPNLRRYVENNPTNRVDPTGLYGDDVHFYFNYYLARYLGLDQPSGWVNSNGQPISEAYIIAYFATRVDYDAYSWPVGAGKPVRSRFHFPAPGAFQGVTRNDPRVYAALHAVGATGDLEMFGVLLHIYQDSFAHEGHDSATGHASDRTADVPYYHMLRDFEMSIRVYYEMVDLLLARRGVVGGVNSPQAQTLLTGRSLAGFWTQVDTVLTQTPRGTAGSTPYARRLVCWEQLIFKDFNRATPRFLDNGPGLSNELTRRFRAVAEQVPQWYGKSYNHPRQWGQWQPVQPDGPPPWNTNGNLKYRFQMNPQYLPPYGQPKY